MEHKLRHRNQGDTLEPGDNAVDSLDTPSTATNSEEDRLNANDLTQPKDAIQNTAEVAQEEGKRSQTLAQFATKYLKFAKHLMKGLGVVGNLISPIVECYNEWKSERGGKKEQKVALCITGMCRKQDDVVVGVLAGLGGAKVGAGVGAALGSVVPGAGTAGGALVGGIGGGIAYAMAADKAHSGSKLDQANDQFCNDKHPQVQAAVKDAFVDFNSFVGNADEHFDKFATWWANTGEKIKQKIDRVKSWMPGQDDAAQVRSVGGRKCIKTSTFTCGKSTDCISDPDVLEGTPSCSGEYACQCDTTGLNECVCKKAIQDEREVEDSDKAMEEENCPLLKEGAQFALQASEDEIVGCATVSLKSAYVTNKCCDEPNTRGCDQI